MSSNITLISTILAAIAGALGYIYLGKRLVASKPSISHGESGDAGKPYRHLVVTILPPDSRAYTIEKLLVISPESGRLAHPIPTDDHQPDQASWATALSFPPNTADIGVFYSAAPDSTVVICVQTYLRANPTLRHRITITASMPA